MKKFKSIVTGGAGFIGSNLVDRLVEEGHKVIVIDNFVSGKKDNLSHHSKKNVKIIKSDISNNKKLYKHFKGVNYVFHLAGLAEIVPSIENPRKYFINNTLGTLNILEAAKQVKIKKFIYAASSSCYGTPKKIPTKETDKIDTKHPYAFTKFLGEEAVIKYANFFRMPNISCRFFNVYGPRLNRTSQYGAVFSNFLTQKKRQKPLTIVGNGRQTRDFIHVDDLTNAFVILAKSNLKNKIYNLGSGKETSINKIASTIGGKKIFISKRPGDPNRSCANISKIKKDIHWQPKISINEGIRRLFKD
jgi:UDP-glucose 4-epimerase